MREEEMRGGREEREREGERERTGIDDGHLERGSKHENKAIYFPLKDVRYTTE